MRLGEVLVLRGMARRDEIEAALDSQRQFGGRLGDNLIAAGLVTAEQLASVMEQTPPMPHTVADTGVSRGSLLNLLLKFMRVESCETIPELAVRMKLPNSVIQELIDDAIYQKFIQVLGSANVGIVRYIRYSLSDAGRIAAGEAMEHSGYLGPAPVSLAAFQAQVSRQQITNEAFDADAMRDAFGGLVVPDHYVRKLLPAIRAGRSVLLYGPPGNGKTTIANRISSLFSDAVYIPYAIEVAGQIIRIHDSSLHRPYLSEIGVSQEDIVALGARGGLQIEGFDARWEICRRPVAIAGGELSMEMLELRYDEVGKYYDAPLHIKALNGIFLIDDFGRQRVNPTELLNRWIVPLENRIDYLKLTSGKTFSLPFDELVIFSTNLQPADLMDPAFLRRIPYKIRMFAPEVEEFRSIFDACADSCGLTLNDDAFDFVVSRLTAPGAPGLAYFQPKFICEQVVQECICFDLKPEITQELAGEALANLYVGRDGANTAPLQLGTTTAVHAAPSSLAVPTASIMSGAVPSLPTLISPSEAQQALSAALASLMKSAGAPH